MCRVVITGGISKFAILLFLLGAPSSAQISVLTQHNDAARDGLNASETVLTLSSVSPGNFGKLLNLPTDGAVYAQPLVVPGVTIPGKGTHDVVYVATMHDSVYAYDADGLTLTPLWQESLAALGCPSGWTCTSLLTQDEYVSATDIQPEIGILSTPVIDSNTMYVVAKTKEVSGSTTNYVYRLHALDITSGAERTGSPVVIQGQVPGTGNPNSGGNLVFSPHYSLQRPGLALVNKGIYMGFGAAGDDDNWHGWVFGYDETALTRIAEFSATPNGGEGHGGIWMHGGGLASDTAGSLYFSTGNGAFDGASNFGDTFLRLTTPALAVGDYFAPYNQANLDGTDLDVSSGAVTLLPDSAGTTQHPHIMIGCAKNGALYVLDRDNLGHFNSSGDTQIIQELLNVVGGITGVDPLGNSYIENCYSTAAYWQGRVYFGGITDNLKMFTFSNGLLSTSATSQSSEVYGFPGASPSVTANGATQGIVWAIEFAASGNAVLHAYDATNLTSELYNSSQNASDVAGPAVKFATPTVANGKAYVGTQNSLAVYGLFSAQPQAAAPSFSQPGGTYSGSVSVSIEEATQGTTVYYTTDGSTPTTSSSIYAGTLVINSTETLNAMAVGGGYRTSPITTATYVVGGTGGSGIAFIQGNYATPQSSQSSVSVTYQNPQLAGDFNLVAVGWNDTTATVLAGGVTDSKGNPYTLAVGPTVLAGNLTQAIYYAKNISAAAAGTNTVTVQFSPAAAFADVRVVEFTGADSSNPIDVAGGASGNGTNSSVAITTTVPNDVIVGANIVSTLTSGPGSGFTQLLMTSPDGDIVEDAPASATGTYTASAPLSTAGNWIMQAVAFHTPATNPPTVTSVSPVSGSTAGGTAVTITGTNFAAGATVTFGGTPATNVVVVSATQITATTPAHAAGAVTMTVTVNGQRELSPMGTRSRAANSEHRQSEHGNDGGWDGRDDHGHRTLRRERR